MDTNERQRRYRLRKKGFDVPKLSPGPKPGQSSWPPDHHTKIKGKPICSCERCLKNRRVQYKKWVKNNPGKNYIIRRRYQLKRRYGVTSEIFDSLLNKQKNRCAICGTEKPKMNGWVIDHSHFNNRIRGILCAPCNIALGAFKDDIKLLKKAIKYLKEPKN